MEKDIQQLRQERELAPEINVEFTEQEQRQIESYKNSINLANTTQVIQYGAGSQLKSSAFATEILKQVQTKDLGETSNVLVGLRQEIKSFEGIAEKKSLIPFFDSIKKKIGRLQAQYSKVETNINAIELQLERHYKNMMKDVAMFDKLFDENKKYFKELSLYIEAGDQKLVELHDQVLPQMKQEAESDNDPSKIQAYKDMEQQVVRFERKVHDLKLTRMVILQSSPQIRMVQNNSLMLMEKLQSSIVNTLPLWKNQMVLTLGIARSQQALSAQQAVNDATNQLLTRNSEMLRDATVKVAQETERGIVDIETIRKVNSDILSTIDEIVRIQTEGREKRKAVEVELKDAEHQLKQRLLNNNVDTNKK
ncbi:MULTISPECIES: toxic anion resistance protein [Myroides]|uniref:Toxic anion resistance protein n=1 Tax=Myroides albus TaxID=2562892 RepID=A0A6I3LIH6_9FLAO|nr:MULTISPECIES: toxic anion resistance protein [Myroides]MTG98023.1 toxic anion resistance protein [Myroides albus]MVX35920.1 toxic anion resistance protein [Myroides sp. LoEW2-1]UVD80315.1 toxic anion resistance protein [Myroides albus]